MVTSIECLLSSSGIWVNGVPAGRVGGVDLGPFSVRFWLAVGVVTGSVYRGRFGVGFRVFWPVLEGWRAQLDHTTSWCDRIAGSCGNLGKLGLCLEVVLLSSGVLWEPRQAGVVSAGSVIEFRGLVGTSASWGCVCRWCYWIPAPFWGGSGVVGELWDIGGAQIRSGSGEEGAGAGGVCGNLGKLELCLEVVLLSSGGLWEPRQAGVVSAGGVVDVRKKSPWV